MAPFLHVHKPGQPCQWQAPQVSRHRRLCWKETKTQKGFNSIRVRYDSFECAYIDRRPRKIDIKVDSKLIFKSNQSLKSYDQALVLDLEIQRLQRKSLPHTLYIGRRKLNEDEILRIYYPKKAIEKGLL